MRWRRCLGDTLEGPPCGLGRRGSDAGTDSAPFRRGRKRRLQANELEFAPADLRNLLLGDLGLRDGIGRDESVGGIAGVALVADRSGNRRNTDFSIARVEVGAVTAGRRRRTFSVHCFPPVLLITHAPTVRLGVHGGRLGRKWAGKKPHSGIYLGASVVSASRPPGRRSIGKTR